MSFEHPTPRGVVQLTKAAKSWTVHFADKQRGLRPCRGTCDLAILLPLHRARLARPISCRGDVCVRACLLGAGSGNQTVTARSYNELWPTRIDEAGPTCQNG